MRLYVTKNDKGVILWFQDDENSPFYGFTYSMLEDGIMNIPECSTPDRFIDLVHSKIETGEHNLLEGLPNETVMPYPWDSWKPEQEVERLWLN